MVWASREEVCGQINGKGFEALGKRLQALWKRSQVEGKRFWWARKRFGDGGDE